MSSYSQKILLSHKSITDQSIKAGSWIFLNLRLQYKFLLILTPVIFILLPPFLSFHHMCAFNYKAANLFCQALLYTKRLTYFLCRIIFQALVSHITVKGAEKLPRRGMQI